MRIRRRRCQMSEYGRLKRCERLPLLLGGMYKLAFMAAGGLLVAGAILGRAAERSSPRPEMPDQADAQSVVGPDPLRPAIVQHTRPIVWIGTAGTTSGASLRLG